ncbi:MAG: HI0074 family nucleotidyltransferase substrate-binding subunit [Lachnospiraceae bacterium]|nr:HI0074 family nucleotidyltransferase substrate-binding subunit [Lachnospiraceae bacterium]
MKKFENYCSNLTVLSAADQQDLNNEFIIGGIIDKFTIQFELGWKVLKELLRYEGRGEANSGSPREILKTAFELYDFVDEELWLAMLKDRNSMNHIYDGQAARDLVQTILERYIPAFQLLRASIAERYAEQLEQV